MPLLDLTQYSEASFEAIKPGKYFASILDAEDRETGDGGKMPAGTPMLWVHFLISARVDEELAAGEVSEYDGKHAFRNLVVPPEDYDEKARKAMNGMLVQLFKACGWSEEDITSGEFDIDADDLKEKELVIQLNRRPDKTTGEMRNNVVGFFSIESVTGDDAAPSVI